MRLVSVYDEPLAARLLYELLLERPRYAWISHKKAPTYDEHRAFVARRPFFHWYLIESAPVFVGSIEVTDRNEIGIAILERHKRQGYAAQALSLFISSHKPLPAIPAVRNERWLANIASENEIAKDFFSSAGFEPLQETWAL